MLSTKLTALAFGLGITCLTYYSFILSAPSHIFRSEFIDFSRVGRWEPSIQAPLVPVAATVLVGTNEVLLWAADSSRSFGNVNRTIYAIYDPKSGTMSARRVSQTEHNMFCPGVSIDGSGNVIVTGGSTSDHISIYNETKDSWSSGPSMQVGRGYHAQVTLSDGRIFTIGGSWAGGISQKDGEIFSPHTQAWRALPGCKVEAMLTADNLGTFAADNHAWLFAWKNGSAFQAGPSKAMNWYSMDGAGSFTRAGLRGLDNDAMNGNAVMYDAGEGKILAIGGAPSYSHSKASRAAHIITITQPFDSAIVEAVGPMHAPRAYANSVVLPTGDVFVNGGASYALQWTDLNATWHPELWNHKTAEFSLMARMPIPRTYHSVALLLPDATVLTGGGGLCWEPCDQIPQWNRNSDHLDIQVFSPPYLFNSDGKSLALRPKIISLSSTQLSLGSPMTVTVDTEIEDFTLIRYGSVTHSVNTDQRRVVLPSTQKCTDCRSTDVGRGLELAKTVLEYDVNIPDDAGVVVPGYWMLFAITKSGVPSVAKTLLLKAIQA